MIDLTAPIKEVTVYADRALISRRSSISLEAGEHELRINDLPQFIQNSLRAAGQGPEGTRILNVDVTTAFHSRPPEAELAALHSELETLHQNKQLLEARQQALNDRRQWLRALGEQSRDFAKGLAQGQMKPQDCADFFRFTAEQALQDAEAAQSLVLQLKHVQQDIQAKERELTQKHGNVNPDRLAAVIAVSLTTAGDLEMEISYLIIGASWYPQYDVRVNMADDKNEGDVELTYVGVVQQTTGERWENVGLSLSTARPSLAAVLPELEPWYLTIPTAVPVAGPHSTVRRARMSDTVSLLNADMAMEQGVSNTPMFVAATIATATVEQTGTALLFRIGRSVDIPSDNSPHKTAIARDELSCTFDYVSAPVLEEQVHLRAAISNTTERVLLSGDASIFLSGEYVGTTQIKTTAPTEKFKIFLGTDDSIKVKRELIERDVDKGSLLQGGIRRTIYAYRIHVHNYTDHPHQVVIRDHLPVSQHERVKVKVQNVQPPPKEHSKLELLIWQFTLPPSAQQQIEYRFIIEQPQGVTVTGLT